MLKWLKSRWRRSVKGYARGTVQELLDLLDSNQRPNKDRNLAWHRLHTMELMQANVKNMGYLLAQEVTKRTGLGEHTHANPGTVGLNCQASTQQDIESPWFSYWCQELQVRPIYHRKLWEFAYVLQALQDHFGDLQAKPLKGIVFGCGEEPIPALLARYGHQLTITDLDPEQSAQLGWIKTSQHTHSKDACFFDNLVDRETYDKQIELRYVDMREIPDDLAGQYDFTWSVCAMEHLGSIAEGSRFVVEAMKVLKPGGLAVHTTEYNYADPNQTIDNWETVLFQGHHFENIRDQLHKAGHQTKDLILEAGEQVLDQFIDLPPFADKRGWLTYGSAREGDAQACLKITVEGIAATCFGLIAERGSTGV